MADAIGLDKSEDIYADFKNQIEQPVAEPI